MVKPIMLEEEPITLSEIKTHLERIEKEDGELNFRAQRVKEYLEDFQPIKPADAKKVAQKLESLDLSRLKPDQIIKIVNFMPKTEEELSVLLQGFSITISKADQKKVLAALDEVRPS